MPRFLSCKLAESFYAGGHESMTTLKIHPRSWFALAWLLACAFLSNEPARTAPAPQAARPNVLFLITDDQRFDMMGNVNPLLHTPEMDRLAREGVRFEQAFVTTSICAASRASLLCGLVERSHRYSFLTPPLADSLVDISFPKLLREAGYRTGYVGKFGVNLHPGATARLYDYFEPRGHPYWKKQPDGSLRHLTDIEGDLAVKFLEAQARAGDGRPFCLTVGFNAPHAQDADPRQYFWQHEVDSLYQDVKVPRPPLSDAGFYNHLPEFLRDGTMNRHRWRWRFDFESKRQEMTKGYWRMISGVDLVIGRLRQKLDQLHFSANTVIILIGDNGYFLGERGYAGKWLPYEPSIHVPLLMFDPIGRFSRANLRPTNLVLNIDVPPTILDVAGVPIPEKMQGRSLVALARGEAPADWRKDIWIEHLMMEPSIRKHEGVRTERYKYIRYFEANPVLEELYDLREDPLETVNLVNSPRHRPILEQLRRRTNQLRDQYGGEFSARLWKEPRP
jgi:arylsulfatase A-like enzyme